MATLINEPRMKLSAELTATSNGEGTKSTKVSLVARTNQPINDDLLGTYINDFAGLKAKSKIPLDWDHDESDSNGYINAYEVNGDSLVCSGFIVAADGDSATRVLVDKLENGVPYEASIEFWLDDDLVCEYVPEFGVAIVNGVQVEGPITIVREWRLRAVAITKFGADSGTSVALQLSKAKQKNEKGFVYRLGKNIKGNIMTIENNKESKNEVLADTQVTSVETPAEVKPVEAVVEEVKEPVTEIAAEVKPVEVASEVEPVAETPVVEETEVVEEQKVDSRSEFKQFVEAFGADKAVAYFTEDLSFADASKRYLNAVKAENEELRKRLSAVSDRGGNRPIKLSDTTETKVQRSLAQVINLPGKR